jgi:dolichol-phosphate mannosyltransferase
MISVVIPFYNGKDCLLELIRRLENVLSTIDTYEIILVDDRSPDNGWQDIEALCKSNSKIKGILLSKNHGQHYAIAAGLDHVSGEWTVVMDCDLQDLPEEIPSLHSQAKKGFEIVLARRTDRTDSSVNKLTSKLFYNFLAYLTGEQLDSSVANFGIYHSKVIEAVRKSGEAIRFFPSQINNAGFKKTFLDVKHGIRPEGHSSYSLGKRLKLALDIVLSNTDRPLRMVIRLGMFISFVAFLASILVIINWWRGNITVSGYTSIILSVWFLSGLIISILGILGLYIGKIFEQVKAKPLYIIDTANNIDRK